MSLPLFGLKERKYDLQRIIIFLFLYNIWVAAPGDGGSMQLTINIEVMCCSLQSKNSEIWKCCPFYPSLNPIPSNTNELHWSFGNLSLLNWTRPLAWTLGLVSPVIPDIAIRAVWINAALKNKSRTCISVAQLRNAMKGKDIEQMAKRMPKIKWKHLRSQLP